jgi:hypothetical protein
MARLRAASIFCLAIWVAIWLLFLVMHFSPFDYRGIPGIGGIVLSALAIALLALIVSTTLAVVAVIRQPPVTVNWLSFGCAVTALFGQAGLFLVSSWF